MQGSEIIIQEKIAQSIYMIRNAKVMMDSVLVDMYGVSTKVLNQAVKRNRERFPDDFMFQLTDTEWENLRSQFVTSRQPAQKASWGGRRIPPYVFTEQGVAMLSSVLNSQTAIQVNISIMRVFVKMRQWATNYQELADKMDELQHIQGEQSQDIVRIYQIIEELVKPQWTERKQVRFKSNNS
jgi:hypothetical protein